MNILAFILAWLFFSAILFAFMWGAYNGDYWKDKRRKNDQKK